MASPARLLLKRGSVHSAGNVVIIPAGDAGAAEVRQAGDAAVLASAGRRRVQLDMVEFITLARATNADPVHMHKEPG